MHLNHHNTLFCVSRNNFSLLSNNVDVKNLGVQNRNHNKKKNGDDNIKYDTVSEMHTENIITHFLSLCFTGFPLSRREKILDLSRQGLNSTVSRGVPREGMPPENFEN